MPVAVPVADARRFGNLAGSHPLDHVRWTEPQREFLSDPRTAVIWVDGNQLGKTWALIADCIYTCRGIHPFREVPKPPTKAVLISESWDQMGTGGSFFEKLWSLLPLDEIDPRVELDPGRGITGKPPRVPFVRGPGAGSLISFATFRQGPKRLAGPTIGWVGSDEPPPGGLVEEMIPRLLVLRGKLRLVFTPVPGMPDVSDLRRLVREKKLYKHNHGLSEASAWPMGSPSPIVSQAEIDQQMGLLPEFIRRLRVRGDWDAPLSGRWVSAYDDERHVSDRMPPAEATIIVSVDHGSAPGRTVAELVVIAEPRSPAPGIHYYGESAFDVQTTEVQDVDGILALLDRRGIDPRDVDAWVGDRAIATGSEAVRRSNRRLEAALAARGIVGHDGQQISFTTPHKFSGSVEVGVTTMNAAFAEGRAWVHPECVRLRRFLGEFEGDRRSPLKDAGDAARYAVEEAVEGVEPFRALMR